MIGPCDLATELQGLSLTHTEWHCNQLATA